MKNLHTIEVTLEPVQGHTIIMQMQSLIRMHIIIHLFVYVGANDQLHPNAINDF